MKLQLFAVGVFALAAACAPTAQTASSKPVDRTGRDCFNADFISGYTAVDDKTVRVSAGPKRDYDLDIVGAGCGEIKWMNSIVIVSKPSPWIGPLTICFGRSKDMK